MARKTKTTTTTVAEVEVQDTNTNTQATTVAEPQATHTEQKLERANRVSVKVWGEGYQADFYRTHKKLATVHSEDTIWKPTEGTNKSAQREDFRQFVIDTAPVWGIEWKPQDMRAEGNRRMAKYETDEDLMADTVAMLSADIDTLVAKCPYEVSILSVEAEAIVPMTHTAKGSDLARLGVIEGKYERSGNWAWAEVEVAVTLTKGGETMYYTTKCQLVSGQLKKPHITQTSFNESIKESLKEVGLWEEPKAEDTKAE